MAAKHYYVKTDNTLTIVKGVANAKKNQIAISWQVEIAFHKNRLQQYVLQQHYATNPCIKQLGCESWQALDMANGYKLDKIVRSCNKMKNNGMSTLMEKCCEYTQFKAKSK